jgi:hypothetical protein
LNKIISKIGVPSTPLQFNYSKIGLNVTPENISTFRGSH